MKQIRLGDIAIFIVSIAIIAFSLGRFTDFSGEPQVHVRTDGGEFIYDLGVDAFATFNGPVGETSIEIKDGKVHVHDSDCRNKVCISAGWVSRVGDWIICLPNNVFVLIEGAVAQETGGVDDTAF
ncbi:MAG TPA: NusG domain II-containing protein [Sphaerochaetaceae bacterium]|jgi:hypothetical protein|nr:NusG domain II-containing protein [Sphaerochaetaceae bacterium]